MNICNLGRTLAVTCVALACAMPAARGAPGVVARFKDPHPIIIAHRGCWRVTSENSLSGLNACAEHGIDMIEIDIRATRDGELVLMHDESVDRTTDLTGRVADLSRAQFKSAHLRFGGGGPEAAITNESPPTFVEMLRAARGKVVLYLDVQVGKDMEAILKAIEQERAQDWVVFPTSIEDARKLPGWARIRSMPIVIDCATGSKDCDPSLAQAMEESRDLRPLSIGVLFNNDAYVLNGMAPTSNRRPRLCAVSVSAPQWDGGRDEASPSPGAHEVWNQLLKLGFSILETNDALELSDYLHSKADPERGNAGR
jgi:glycerophosphoryl diester phosphodiesterase